MVAMSHARHGDVTAEVRLSLSFRASASESRNRDRAHTGPSAGNRTIPRLRASGAPLGM